MKCQVGALLVVCIIGAACTGTNEPIDTATLPPTPVAQLEPDPEVEDEPVATPTSLEVNAAPATVAPSEADGLRGIVAFVGISVFDGVGLQSDMTVVIENGLIVAVGSDVEIPSSAQIVDGEGQTLLPGLIDSHTHNFDDALDRTLAFGVTTHLDMFTDPRYLAGQQAAEAVMAARPEADLFSSGILGTVDGGHGTQFGVPVPTLNSPAEASDWVQDRVDEGAAFIKLVLEDGSQFGGRLPTLDEATLRAAIDEAAQRDLLVVTHVGTRESAFVAITNGSDGLAHLFTDTTADREILDLMLDEAGFIVPTLVVLSSASTTPSGQSVIDDDELGPRLLPDEVRNLAQKFPGARLELDVMVDSVRKLHAAGVPVLAGSDAPNPGTTFGASLHRELQYFTEAGMTPAEALASATSVPADIFGLTDRGRIATGLTADLLLVTGDPTVDITATRSIVAVWKDGIPIPIG